MRYNTTNKLYLLFISQTGANAILLKKKENLYKEIIRNVCT